MAYVVHSIHDIYHVHRVHDVYHVHVYFVIMYRVYVIYHVSNFILTININIDGLQHSEFSNWISVFTYNY